MDESGGSQADRDLAGRLSQRLERKVTERQVRRLRQQGYLSPRRRGLGRGLGTNAFYSEEATEQAVGLMQALAKQGHLDEAALIVFLKGFPIKVRALKRAYSSVFDRFRRAMQLSPDEDPWDAAYRLSRLLSRRSSRSPTAKQWREHLREKGKGHMLAPALHDLVRFIILGDAEEGETLSPEVLEALGLQELFSKLPGEDQSAFNDLVRQLSFPALQERVEQAASEEIEKARSDFRLLLDLFPDWEAIEFTYAFAGIPATLVGGPLLGVGFSTAIGQFAKGG